MEPVQWTRSAIGDCLDPTSLAGGTKVQARDYRTSGRFPIVDQGQQQIAGWTEDESAVIDGPLPVIVFGDHTRVFKFIDFPFARGADGTQLLKPKQGIDPLFFFYACRSVDLPTRGYNRHFSVLKEKVISLPLDGEEQRVIGQVLRCVEHAWNHQSSMMATVGRLKRASMRELFERGLHREPQKETEIGRVPKSWEIQRLDERAQVVSTRMSYSELELLQDLPGDGVKVLGIKVSDMNSKGNEIELRRAALEKVVEQSVASSRCARPGTIVFPKRGAAIATNKKRLTSTWTVFDPNVIGVVAQDGLEQRFLFHWFQLFDLRSITEPGPTPQLNKKNLDPLLIPVPRAGEEQREIAAVVDALDGKLRLHRQKGEVLERIFKALLHNLMTGEIRVSDLDLSAVRAGNGVAA